MVDTPKLLMPYIAQSQASKEVTHSESLDDIDILVMCNILDRDLFSPPASAVTGSTYIVKAPGTGGWAGHDNHIAAYISVQWKFSVPSEGWILYVQDENLFVFWDGTAWTAMATQGTFTALSDTPASYTGHTLKIVRVNAGETALEFTTLTAGAADFLGLTDTPNSYTAQTLKYVRVNAGETALEFAAGSVGAFVNLTDTFASYAGKSQQFLAVNAGETAVEAVDAPGGSLGLHRGALVKRTSDLTIANSTATKIPWQAEIYDTDAMWAVGTPTKIIIPVGITKVMIFGQIRITAATIPNLRLRLLKNNAIGDGLTYLNYGVQDIIFSADEGGIPFASPPVAVVAADELELEMYQDSGATLDLQAGEHSFFGVIVIAPVGGAPDTAQYVTLATDATLTDERVLTAGTNVLLTDAGAGSTVTVDALTQNVALPGDISPAQLTANTNDYAPTGLSTASTLRLSTDASRNLTGLTGGADGRLLIMHNVGSFPLVLVDESVSSSAANRFALTANLSLAADDSCLLRYDNTSSRWRMIGTSAAQAAITPDTGWAVSNVTPDKVFDANSTTMNELADVLGTLITTLITQGILSA